MDNFLYVDLSATDLKNFDGMAAGEFTDMRGHKVKLGADELPDYITNTLDVLESTRGASGDLVGLPIDADNHDHKGGAGWIKGLTLDAARNVVLHSVEWTEMGADLIRTNARRFYSPTIDLANKTILGGSLTNWPATRDKKGRILLRPIELSTQLQEIDMETENSMNTFMQSLTDLGNKIVEAINGRKPEPEKENKVMDEVMTMAEFMQTPEAIAELEARAEERANELLTAERLSAKVSGVIAKLTSEGDYALALNADNITAAILALPEADKVLELIEEVAGAKVANFAERGSNGRNENEGKSVPDEIKGFLSKWVEAGKEVSEFFSANPELGTADEYDLSEYEKEIKND